MAVLRMIVWNADELGGDGSAGSAVCLPLAVWAGLWAWDRTMLAQGAISLAKYRRRVKEHKGGFAGGAMGMVVGLVGERRRRRKRR
jgi:hypothetical protein